MARITIELDTGNGDTLQDVVNAILAQTKPVPHGNTASGAAAGDLTPKDLSYTSSDTINLSTTSTSGATVKVETKPGSVTAGLNGPVVAYGPFDGDRKRGEPGAGHRRRTNAEIAEDKLYFDSLNVPGHVAVAAMENGVEPKTRYFYHPESDSLFTSLEQPGTDGLVEEVDFAQYTKLKKQQEQARAAISTGAERIDPDNAQDAADEAAESAKSRGAEPTLDDLRRAVGAYQKKFGMEQAARRTKEILGMPLFEVPSKDFGVMIHRVMAAVEHDQKDGAKFTPVQTQSGVVQQATIVPPTTATRDEVNAALNDYATRYDGSLDPKQMPITREDVPRLLERLFGAGKKSFNDFEKSPENLGRVLAAVRAEIEKNTFGRTPK